MMTTGPYDTATPPVFVSYSPDIEDAIAHLIAAFDHVPSIHQRYRFSLRWLAIQLLEGDESIREQVVAANGGDAVLRVLEESLAHLHPIYPDGVDIALADQRYQVIHNLVRATQSRPDDTGLTRSDIIDRIVTHRLTGIPIFLALMWIVFKITTDVSVPFMDWVDYLMNEVLSRWVVTFLGMVALDGTWLQHLLTDGVLAGVGGVLVFVPVLIALYLALAVLEDSGYMTRAAFIMDRLMHTIGLHGKSFLPLVVGFGCNVPALYATRTLENEKDRILTGLLVPFMSCGARLPVYILLATIFFPRHADLVIFGIYIIGILVAILLGIILKHTLFQDKQNLPLIMELPPYRLPAPKNIWFYTWTRTSAFIKQATTIILVGSVVVWTLTAIPVRGAGSFANTPLEESAFASVAGLTSHLFTPLGFGSWQISGALISGIVAKEMIVSTTAQIFHIDETEDSTEPAPEPPTILDDIASLVVGFGQATLDTLKSVPLIVGIDLVGAEEEQPSDALMHAVRGTMERSSGGHGALAALACMLFVLIYTPCMVTVAALRHELGNRWMWLSIWGQLLLAWLIAFLVFQGGLLFGWG